MGENIEAKDVQKTEYLDKNGLDMLWAKVKENTHNQVEVERNRAVAKEDSIIDTKADTTALDSAKAELDKKISDETTRATQNEIAIQNNVNSLSSQIGNFVRINELDQQIDTLNTAISAKQDKPDDGNMFLQVKHDSVSGYFKRKGELKFTNDDNDSFYTSISPSGIYCWNENSSTNFLRITSAGITLDGGEGTSGYAFTTNGKTARIPTKLSQLTNDSNFITANTHDEDGYHLLENLNIGLENNGVLTMNALGIESTGGDGFGLNGTGIRFYARGISDIPTAQGSFINIDDYALNSQVTALEQAVKANTTALKGKQDAGNYIPYTDNYGDYGITSPISVMVKDRESVTIYTNRISISGASDPRSIVIERDKLSFSGYDAQMPNYSASTEYTINGITSNKYNNCLATSDGTFKPISDFVLKSVYYEKIAALEARIAALEAKHPEAAA